MLFAYLPYDSSLVKNLPPMQGTLVQFLSWQIHWRRARLPIPVFLGLSCGSAGKESTCNAGDLGWEDPLEKGKQPTSNILACRVHGIAKSQTGLSD